MSLTQGAIRQLVTSVDGSGSNPSFQPTVQCVSIKPVGGASGNQRYRIVLSDGTHYCHGMMSTQLNSLVENNEIQQSSLFQINEFMTNKVQGKSVVILLDILMIQSDYPNGKIGQPTDIESAGVSNGGNAAAGGGGAQPLYNRSNHQGAQNQQQQQQPAKANNNPYGGGNVSGRGNNNPYGQQQQQSNPYGGGGSSNNNNNMYGGGGSGGGGNAAIVRQNTTSTGVPITPIDKLNMYQNRWTIRARVTSKGDIRTWQNAKGEGSLFSIDLLDNSGTDIRATFFKEAVEKFYHMLEVDKVYTFSGGRLKVANMQYNTCKSSHEITFDPNSEIHLDNDTGDIQQQTYEFKTITELEHVDAGKNIDIIAVVKNAGEPQSLVSKKTGKELTKADLTLIDDTGVEVTCTIWGDRANQVQTEFGNNPIIAVKGARVSDYNGKSLSGSSSINVNPRVPETQRIQNWWSANSAQIMSGMGASRSLTSSSGGGGKFENLFERKTISSIKNEGLGHSEKPDWFTVKATINFIKKDKEGGAWYTACANAGEPCKNRFKVTQNTEGHWHCDKCQGTYPDPVRRWIFSATCIDDTSTTWVSLFNEQAEQLFEGLTADGVYKETFGADENGIDSGGSPQDLYDSYFAKASHTDWLMKCKVKTEMNGEEQRVKTSVYSMIPIDYAKESRDLLQAISKM